MADPAQPPQHTFRFDISQDEIFENLRIITEHLRDGIEPGQLSREQITALLEGLPRIDEKQLIELGEKDNFCPICFVPYLTILTEEEMASAMDSPAHPVEELGVTKLSQSWQCCHMFCRRDISKWIFSGHASCPMCRRNLAENATPDQQATDQQLADAVAGLQDYNHATATMTRQMDSLGQYLHPIGAGAEFGALLADHLAGRGGEDDESDDEDRREYSGMYS